MVEECEMTLPASGLAEDVLARFMESAQIAANMGETKRDRQEGDSIHHLVTFTLGKEEFGVAIGCVQEIIRATDITSVPGAPGHVRGVINLRGKIIPVIDLRKRFNLPAAEAGDAERIVVVELGVKRLGMLVDGVSQVIKVPAEVVETLPEEATSVDENYISGVGKLDSRLIIMLDLNRLLV
jgi:purine-binding chemotaxis protein CheW